MAFLGTDAPGTRAPRAVVLPLVAAVAWLVVLACLEGSAGTARHVVVAGGLGAVLALVLARRLGRAALAAALVLLGAGAGAAAAAQQLGTIELSPVTAVAEEQDRVELTVVLRGDPRPRAQVPQPGRATHTVAGRVVALDGAALPRPVDVVLLVSGEAWTELLPSQRVTTTARVVPAEDDALTAGLVLAGDAPATVDPPTTAHELAGRARARLRDAATVLPQPVRGLLPAVVVGDRAELDPGLAEDFRVTGLTHIMVPSGAKLAIMLGASLGVLRLLRAPVWLQVVAGSATIAVFVLVCRPEPSVVRAAVMGGLGLLALALGRSRDALAVLATAVVGALLFDPQLARSYGFALSVLATAGLLTLAPRWRDRWAPHIGRPLAEVAAVALAAQVACYPVLVLLAPEVSLISVPANAVATVFVPAATVVGFAVAALALVSVSAAQVLVWLAAAPVAVIALIAERAAQVPHGTVPWPGGPLGVAALTGLLVVAVAARGRWGTPLAAAACVVLLGTLTLQAVAPPWPPRGWILVACDVDQGDALVLASGGSTAVVVDAGPDPVTAQRCLRTLGVRQVDLLVLTHDHDDHTGGLPGVLRHREVTAALAPPELATGSTARRVTSAGVPLRTAEPGQLLQAGPWELEVLWPAPDGAGNVNDRSVVLRATWADPVRDRAEVTVLLTGDVEEPAQARLLERDAAALDVDVLKTPHHGAGTQVPEFLAATRAEVTVTSLGSDNPHGHPTPQTWAQLTALTERSFRTDVHGDIAVLPGPRGVVVEYRGTDASG